MEGILELFQTFVNSDSDSLDIYLDALDEHKSFFVTDSHAVDNVVQIISSSLTNSEKRGLGLKLLNRFVNDFPTTILEQKLSFWTTFTLKACTKRYYELYPGLVFNTLSRIAKASQRSPDLVKSFANNHLIKIYEAFPNASPTEHLSVLQCVENTLRLYPGVSGKSRGIIQQFLLSFIDSRNDEYVKYSGKCQLLLQQVRGGGAEGINYKNQWQGYQLKLLGSLHLLQNLAFANCSEVYDEPIVLDQLEVPTLELSDEPVRRAMQLYSRFRNLTQYLIIALREPYPVVKPIFPKKILNLIGRCLAVTCGTIQRNIISENIALGIVVPNMHYHMLQVLEALMQTLRSHLKSYHHTILGFLSDVLKWTTSSYFKTARKPFTKLRIKAYDLIVLWCSMNRSGSRCELIAELLIQQILNDVSIVKSEFTLEVQSGARKHMTKKARRQLNNIQNKQSQMASNSVKGVFQTEEGNQLLYIAALKCLQRLLLSSSNFLKPTLMNTVQNNILQICCSIVHGTSSYDSSARIEAYNTLYILLLVPHHLCPPPTQLIFTIFRMAQSEDNVAKVRNYCGDILSNLDMAIHPQKDTLSFATNIRDIRSTFFKSGLTFANNISKNNLDVVNENTNKLNDSEIDDDDDDDVEEEIEHGKSMENEADNRVIYEIEKNVTRSTAIEETNNGSDTAIHLETTTINESDEDSPDILPQPSFNFDKVNSETNLSININDEQNELLPPKKKKKLQHDADSNDDLTTIGQQTDAKYSIDSQSEMQIVEDIAAEFVDELN